MIVWATTTLVVASLLALALASVRLVIGPTSADRIVALDIFLAAGVALAVAASLLTARTVFLDVAIGLALVGFVGTIGWARLVERAESPGTSEERP
jgi:multicomponent Na+:H+ antiporter subunit F